MAKKESVEAALASSSTTAETKENKIPFPTLTEDNKDELQLRLKKALQSLPPVSRQKFREAKSRYRFGLAESVGIAEYAQKSWKKKAQDRLLSIAKSVASGSSSLISRDIDYTKVSVSDLQKRISLAQEQLRLMREAMQSVLPKPPKKRKTKEGKTKEEKKDDADFDYDGLVESLIEE